MSFIDSVMIAVFGLGLVFIVLVGLSGVITIESKLLGLFTGKKKDISTVQESEQADINSADLPDISAGSLRLYDVDEKTAAMIMAIVSDESKIPLSQLIFKSIKALD